MDIFENICRTCGCECTESLNIFDAQAAATAKSVSIPVLLAVCLPASLSPVAEDDDFPKQICMDCHKRLISFHEFKQGWESASSEFNVAIKYDQRRKRARNSLAQTTATPAIKSEKISPAPSPNRKTAAIKSVEQKQQPAKGCKVVEVFMTMGGNGEANSTDIEDAGSTMLINIESNAALAPEDAENESVNTYELIPIKQEKEPAFSCSSCDKKFHTLQACNMHRKFKHRN